MERPEVQQFEAEKQQSIAKLRDDLEMRQLTNRWFTESCHHRYSYHFSWMGLPIIQYPQDIVAMQEIIWQVKPDLIIETGIARGGSLIFYASMLELLGGDGRVVGIDIDIRAHNREKLESHPMFKRISLIQGSSIADDVVAQVHALAQGKSRVLVALDSNHTHAHVARELALYAPFVTKGSYLVVFDTVVEDMPAEFFQDRPWGPGDSPMTAVHEFLKSTDRFEIDHDLDAKLQISVAPEGYLKCLKD